MPRDIEMTRGQARQLVADHVAKHGREMELTPEAEAKGIGRHDVPTQEDMDAEFPWEREGKKRPPHPDD
jgi:hypothetical protein